MKQKLLNKLWLRVGMIVAVMTTALAGTVKADTKTEGFETATAGTTYNSTQTYNASASDCGIGWTMYYGTVSTNAKISGTKSAQMRWYSSAKTNYPYIKTTTAIDNLSKVEFTAKVGNTNVKMDVAYSADGSSWTNVASAVTFENTNVTSFTYNIPSGGKYIKIGVASSGTAPSSGNYTFVVDDVVFTYTTSAPTYTITAQSNNTDYGTVSLSGNVITGAPNSGYRYATPAYSVSPANSATVSQNGNEFTVTPSANTTVTINFEAIPCYTVTYSDGGSVAETTGGAGVTLDTRSAIGSYEFVGWSTTEVATETTTAPTIISTSETYYPTANITLYPVYAKAGGGAATPSPFSVGDTGDYAIVSAEQNGKYYALPTNPTVSNGKITAQEITVSETDGVKYVTTANASGFTWTIAAATYGYSLYDGNNYIYHSNGGVSGTNVAYGNSTTFTWAFSKDGNYVTMKGMNSSDSNNNRGMLFNGTTIGGYALSNASSSGYYKVMILPISAGSTTYYWSSPVAAAVEQPVITVAANPFLFSTTATITCATDGATIKYSYDNSAWNDYSSALTITETTTIYAKAIKDENESTVASVEVTKNLANPTVTVSGDLTLDLDGETNVSAGTLTAAVTYENAAVPSATVTWSGNNNAVATINASTGAVTLIATGEVTFTATYAGNSDYAEATGTKTVTVIDNKAPGSENNPYTVEEAIAFINTLGSATSSTDVYVSGIISQVDSYNSTYSSITYWISDDGTTTGQMEVYSGKGLSGANFSAITDLAVGDIVTVKGKVKMYNSTPEFDKNNQLVSLDRPVVTTPTITVSESNVEATATTGLSGTINVTYNNLTDVLAEVQFVEADGTTSATYNWVVADVNGENNIEYVIDENTSTDARTAYMKVYAIGNEGEAYSGLITITQAGYVAAPTNDNYIRISSLDKLKDGSIVVIAARYDGINENSYYAMHNTLSSGKATGTWFTSTTSNGNEILPSSIVNDEDDYYWVVTVTSDGYEFTNADGNKIGYGTSGTNFVNGGTNTTWTIESLTSESGAMVEGYTGFVIKNGTTDSRAFAFNGSAFGAYATSNMAASGYNFYLDFFVQMPTETVTVTSAGYATYCSENALDFTGKDIKAYIATADGTTGVSFTQINKVPANTGVLLVGTEGETVNATVPVFDGTGAEDTSNNVFVPGTGAAVASEGTGVKNYILSNGNKGVGFYPASGKTVAVGKAYISVPTTTNVKGFIMLPGFDDDATGIENLNVNNNLNDGAIYNLAGQRISKMQKGINIVNGKKVLK